MEPRRVSDLCQLPDHLLFDEVAAGVRLLGENAHSFLTASKKIASPESARAARVLRAIAEEEASKVMILVDALRCPRSPDRADCFARQLGKFYSHLARGIYADYAGWKPATFREVRHHVEFSRQKTFSEGEEGEYVARNWILSKRESTMYVDYVKDGDTRYWLSPDDLSSVDRFCGPRESAAVNLASRLIEMGCGDASALALLAKYWGEVVITDDQHWSEYREHNVETVSILSESGYCGSLGDAGRALLVDGWLYPLYDLDLRELKQ